MRSRFRVLASGVVAVCALSTLTVVAPPAGAATQHGAPTRVYATPEVNGATLSWKAPSPRGVTGYAVFGYVNGALSAIRVSAGAIPLRTISGLNAGKIYTFRVAAMNGARSGPLSAASNAIAPTPFPAFSSRPPAGGVFRTLPPGSILPSGATCSTRVRYSSWEPRPQNRFANHLTPLTFADVRTHPDFNAFWQLGFRPRILGNFQGTTDEIIQWAACKWGFSDDLIRAQAADESNWVTSTESDLEPRWRGLCPPDDRRNPCPTSFGLLQIKWFYNPDRNPTNNSYPRIKQMTAFGLDYGLAWLRGCYEGWAHFGPKTRGDLWGCVGAWFSGGWHDRAANAYVARVLYYLAAKPWLRW